MPPVERDVRDADSDLLESRAEALFGQQPGGDVGSDAPVSLEVARGVEHRAAAHRRVARRAVVIDALDQQITEFLVLPKDGFVFFPGRIHRLGIGQLPAGLAEMTVVRNAAVVGDRLREADKPEFGILFPGPIGRQCGEKAARSDP